MEQKQEHIYYDKEGKYVGLNDNDYIEKLGFSISAVNKLYMHNWSSTKIAKYYDIKSRELSRLMEKNGVPFNSICRYVDANCNEEENGLLFTRDKNENLMESRNSKKEKIKLEKTKQEEINKKNIKQGKIEKENVNQEKINIEKMRKEKINQERMRQEKIIQEKIIQEKVKKSIKEKFKKIVLKYKEKIENICSVKIKLDDETILNLLIDSIKEIKSIKEQQKYTKNSYYDDVTNYDDHIGSNMMSISSDEFVRLYLELQNKRKNEG